MKIIIRECYSFHLSVRMLCFFGGFECFLVSNINFYFQLFVFEVKPAICSVMNNTFDMNSFAVSFGFSFAQCVFQSNFKEGSMGFSSVIVFLMR